MASAYDAAQGSGRIPELDGLRGLAISLVIICHYVGNAEHAPLGFWAHRMLSAFTVGWSGVDLFFVLSGFLIGGILLDARRAPHYFRAFYMRRVFRILPLYYAWTLLFGVAVVAALVLLPGRTPLTWQDLWQVPLHLLFLQNVWIGMPPWAWIWFVVTWSLAVEEQFYLVAPLLIRFISTRTLVPLLAALICAAPALRFAIYRWSGNPFTASFLMPSRADALSLGILLALAWKQPGFRALLKRHQPQLRLLLLFLLMGVAVLLWWLAHPAGTVTLTIGISWLAIFYSVLLMAVLSKTTGRLASVMRWPLLRGLGVISYGVYILHDTFNQIAHRVLLHAVPEIYDFRGGGVTLLSLALTVGIAALSWRYFEKPLIQRGHSYTYGD